MKDQELKYKNGWAELFANERYYDCVDFLHALIAHTQNELDEEWVKDEGEVEWRWQATIEEISLNCLPESERNHLSEIDIIDVSLCAFARVIGDLGWQKEGVSFVFPILVPEPEGEILRVVFDIREPKAPE